MVYPASGQAEWLEFYNNSDTDSYDLSGMWIAVNQGPENNYTYHYLYDLSGAVPPNGLLTFTFPTGENARLPDDGACISIFIAENSSVFSMKYGNGTCDAGVDVVDATGITIEQGKSINAKESWQMGTPPPTATWSSTSGTDITKGWCSAVGCPVISTIVSLLSVEDVATNLGDQSDYSRASGLYFEKSQNSSALGRITFSNEINLTAALSLQWLPQLDDNLAISQGVISLNADLIKDFTDTQATLIMHNITLSDPVILVDGVTDTQNIVSGLTYDTTADTLTFTVAHFTIFRASERPDAATAPANPGPSVCNQLPPLPLSISLQSIVICLVTILLMAFPWEIVNSELNFLPKFPPEPSLILSKSWFLSPLIIFQSALAMVVLPVLGQIGFRPKPSPQLRVLFPLLAPLSTSLSLLQNLNRVPHLLQLQLL